MTTNGHDSPAKTANPATATLVESKKYRQVIDFVESAIAQGKYREGERLPSESELVRQFRLSRPTVSRAMRELQAGGLIDRRAGSGSYVRAGGRANRPQLLLFGLLIPGLGETEIFESICGQMAREAQDRGHGLLWADPSAVNPDRMVAEKVCEPYLRQAVSGVFFAPMELSAAMDEVNHRIASILNQAGIPIVLLDRDLEPFPFRSKYDLIGIDNFAAGYALGQHLLACGSQTVIFLARPFSAATVRAREAGVLNALMAGGNRPADDWAHAADPGKVDQIRNILERCHPDAIVCANDKTAAELMQTLHGLGVAVPGDVQVVGIDDVRYAKLLRPTLTTIHQPCQDIGTVAMQTMLERVAFPSLPPRQVSLSTHLVVRQSSRPIKVASRT